MGFTKGCDILLVGLSFGLWQSNWYAGCFILFSCLVLDDLFKEVK